MESSTLNEPYNESPVLDIADVSVEYPTPSGRIQAVHHVTLSVRRGEVVGLVGESGCGKSTLALASMRLLRHGATLSTGTVQVNGKDLYQMDPEELRRFRWTHLAMVFQSAMNALNPVMTVRQQMLDTLRSHDDHPSKQKLEARIRDLLDLVRIDHRYLDSYPHELSGGMRQRVVIAMAVSLNPSVIILDEPTTALDVVVQRSILDQIKAIQKDHNFAMLFISHDIGLVRRLASTIYVMYAGRLVEINSTGGLLGLDGNHHPYTTGLLQAIPRLTADKVEIEGIPGSTPDLSDPPTGCSFHPRCPVVMDICRVRSPSLTSVGGNQIACHQFAKSEEGLHG